MKVAALNQGDAIIRKGHAKLIFKLKMPCILGLEGSGTVEMIGSKVTKFKVGDDVIGLYQNNKTGTCAEYAVFEEEEVVLKPSEMSYQQASVIPTVGCTALTMFRKHALIKEVIDREVEHSLQHGKLTDALAENDRPNLKILVIGASGGCGTAAIVFAKGFLTRYFNVKVYAVCSERNTQVVSSLGADVVIDYTKTTANSGAHTMHPKDDPSSGPSICEVVKEHGDNYVDIVLDCVGGYYFYDDVCRNLCTEGVNQVVYSCIAPPGPLEVNLKTLVQLGSYIVYNKVKSYFSGYPSYYFAEMKPNGKDLYFVTHHALMEKNCYEMIPIVPFSFTDINGAHLLLESKRTVGKIALDIQ